MRVLFRYVEKETHITVGRLLASAGLYQRLCSAMLHSMMGNRKVNAAMYIAGGMSSWTVTQLEARVHGLLHSWRHEFMDCYIAGGTSSWTVT